MNLRPSGYEPDELPGCSIPRQCAPFFDWVCFVCSSIERYGGGCAKTLSSLLVFLTRFGNDLLSHALRRSTISAAALNCRVRDGIGCFARAMITKPKKKYKTRWLAACAHSFHCASAWQFTLPCCSIDHRILMIVCV